MPRYKVTLELEEREQLEQLTRKGKIAASKLMHARALLLCDQSGHNNEPFMVKDAAKALSVSTRTIEKLKKRFVEEGLESAIERKPSTRRPTIKFDGEFDARIMQLACSECPQGASRWLNICEIELSVLSRQCLNRRIGTMETIKSEVEKWQRDRNNKEASINWRFTNGNL